MSYVYRSDRTLSPAQFIEILKRSTLDERRPVNSPERIEKMLAHGNVLITAWDNDRLIGISRALTDFSFCCYLSDLAVDKDYQKRGIGKRLVEETHKVAGVLTSLILLAAPAAKDYYTKIGMEHFKDCFIIRRK